MDLKGIPACAFVNGTVTNPFLQVMKKMCGPALEPILKPCPFYGELKVMNITVDLRDFYYIFPEGTYKNIIKFHDDLDDNIITFTVISYLKSGMKN